MNEQNPQVEQSANDTVEKINESAVRDILVAAHEMRRIAERLLQDSAAIIAELKSIESGTDIDYACGSFGSSLEVCTDNLSRQKARVELAKHYHDHLQTLSTVYGRNVCGMPLVERAKETIAIHAE